MDKISFRKIADSDISLIKEWLNKDYIHRWFKHPANWIGEIEKRKSEFSWINHFIAAVNGNPIGFCQYYPCKNSDEDCWGEYSKCAFSIDYLIGEEKFLNKGYGKKIVEFLEKKIFSIEGARFIAVMPDKENTNSSRLLSACGYKYLQAAGIYLKCCKEHFVYILKCADDTLYCGYTDDLVKREKAHNDGKGAKYTKCRLPVKIVCSENFQNKSEAMRREIAIKKMTREEKLRMIYGDKENTIKNQIAELAVSVDQRTLCVWACDCAERLLPIFENLDMSDSRPRNAIAAARAWVKNEMKVGQLRKFAFAAHDAARICFDDLGTAAARSCGQAAGTGHVKGHAVHAANYAALASKDSETEREWQLGHLKELITSAEENI